MYAHTRSSWAFVSRPKVQAAYCPEFISCLKVQAAYYREFISRLKVQAASCISF